jgi:uncharacterized protein (DUF1501 family)
VKIKPNRRVFIGLGAILASGMVLGFYGVRSFASKVSPQSIEKFTALFSIKCLLANDDRSSVELLGNTKKVSSFFDQVLIDRFYINAQQLDEFRALLSR